MKGWKKTGTFAGLYAASLHKNILDNYDIKSVIIEKRDSAFLIGEVELYVEEKNAERASAIIQANSGLIKINGFDRYAPVAAMQNIMQESGLHPILLRKDTDLSLYNLFELYVNQDDYEKAQEVVEKLEDWEKVASYEKENQTAILVDILADSNIDALVVKKRDSDFHILEIQLLVKTADKDKAMQLITELKGWTKVLTIDKFHKVELYEDLFEKNNVPLFVEKKKDFAALDSSFDFYVREADVEEAKILINRQKEWAKIAILSQVYQAELSKGILQENGIEAILVTKKDSAFLLGSVELFVEAANSKTARRILSEIDVAEIQDNAKEDDNFDETYE